MKAITNRILKLEEGLAAQQDETGPSLADVLRERRRRCIAEGDEPEEDPNDRVKNEGRRTIAAARLDKTVWSLADVIRERRRRRIAEDEQDRERQD